MGDPKPQPALKNTQSSRARSCCRKLKACCCEHKLWSPLNKNRTTARRCTRRSANSRTRCIWSHLDVLTGDPLVHDTANRAELELELYTKFTKNQSNQDRFTQDFGPRSPHIMSDPRTRSLKDQEFTIDFAIFGKP
uniref:Uncharacterized protein n=1 Tax=Setaria viridis TaxID=4556 RepID=A0A4U6TXR9_SETVI|nr:hypothetical protein SEVIR_7G191200v2 [Setaria viridis]